MPGAQQQAPNNRRGRRAVKLACAVLTHRRAAARVVVRVSERAVATRMSAALSDGVTPTPSVAAAALLDGGLPRRSRPSKSAGAVGWALERLGRDNSPWPWRQSSPRHSLFSRRAWLWQQRSRSSAAAAAAPCPRHRGEARTSRRRAQAAAPCRLQLNIDDSSLGRAPPSPGLPWTFWASARRRRSSTAQRQASARRRGRRAGAGVRPCELHQLPVGVGEGRVRGRPCCCSAACCGRLLLRILRRRSPGKRLSSTC